MNGDADRIESLAAFAERLADAAALVTLPQFRRDIAVTDKGGSGADGRGDFDPVTAADEGAEDAIRTLIKATYPGHGIRGEEGGFQPGTSATHWVIDPIDGTRAFIAGLPLWTTLIALNDGTKPVLGVIDQPYLGERFIGHAGGALLKTKNETRALATRPRVTLAEAIFSTTSPALFETAREKAILDAITRRVRLTRYGCDAYAYAQLAAGRIDLVVEVGLKPWDVQAVIPIVEAAGGAVTAFDHKPAQEGGSIVAAANHSLLKECLALIETIK